MKGQQKLSGFWRALASCSFLAGGVLTWCVLGALRGLGYSQAGMSAGTNSAATNGDGMATLFFGAYFLTSACALALTNKRRTLWAVAAFAHALSLIGFFAICPGASDSDTRTYFASILILGIITVVFFSPWLMIWGYILGNAKKLE